MNIKKRSYDNKNRKLQADKTKINIINATGALWIIHSIRDISLELIAEKSGITVRTILRKFGSKENLFEECLTQDSANISLNRAIAKPDNIDHIIRTLIDNYESVGDAAIRTINLESEMDIARKIGEKGRESHRTWCANVFENYLPKRKKIEYELKLTSFIAATEIYLWKLLRRDLELDKEKTITVFSNLINGLVLLDLKTK